MRPGALALAVAKPGEAEEEAHRLAERQAPLMGAERAEARTRLEDGREACLIASPPHTLTTLKDTIIYLDQEPERLSAPELSRNPFTLAEALRGIDGFFSALVVRPSGILVLRDHVGAVPINLSARGGVLKASTASAVLPDPNPPPPGRITIIEAEGRVRIIRWHRPAAAEPKTPPKALARALLKAVETLLPQRPAIAFSGGLDSSLLAHLADKAGKQPSLIAVGLKGAPDLEWAEEAAGLLNLGLRVVELREGEVVRRAEKVSPFIQEKTPMNLALAAVFHAAAERCGEPVVAAGQGADELFGGYWKYERLAGECLERAWGEMMRDIVLLHRSSLERDAVACALAGKRLLTPYLSLPVYELALAIPPEKKLRPRRKQVLRDAARILGLPEKLAERPKKAAQYGSGFQRVIEREVF